MNLVRFQKPAYGLSMNNILNELMNENTMWTNRPVDHQTPAVNIKEMDDSFELEFLAPGFDKENFSITNKDGVLTVSAELKKEESKENNYTQKRFSIQSFERAFKLPETVDVEKIAAKYTNGILKVELLKKEVGPEQEMRNIPIL
ncbi:MAG: Hsp20/alpha crystallin family protein [Prolixibacteraceae bacterium]